MKPLHYVLSLTAAAAIAGLALSADPAAAASTAMADCNQQWNDAKAKNATSGTYQEFLTSCLKAAAAAKPADTAKVADPAKTTAAKAADTTKPADAKMADTAKKPDATAKDAKPADTATLDPAAVKLAAAKKDCNKQWKALKDAGTEGTQKKKDFVAACLTKAGVTDTAEKAKPASTMAKEDTTPPEPTAAEVAKNAKPIATVDVNGKPRTPGQIAMDKRIRECGGMWQQAKKDGTTNNLKWPQYWSQCNKKLKAAAVTTTTN
jgi:hypothetical protein